MTTIIRSYTPQGFVIAADGRKCDSENPSRVIDTTQKIIGIEGETRQLGCSFAGVVELTRDQSEETALDFRTEARAAANGLSQQRFDDLFQYAIAFASPINRTLAEIKSSGEITNYESLSPGFVQRGEAIALLWLDGYYHGVPSRVAIRFRHDNQELLEPEIVNEPFVLGTRWVLGPSRIPARRVLDLSPGRCLADEVAACRNYISACSDSESIKIEPACLGIGGHIHIATITLADGFKWAIPPDADG